MFIAQLKLGASILSPSFKNRNRVVKNFGLFINCFCHCLRYLLFPKIYHILVKIYIVLILNNVQKLSWLEKCWDYECKGAFLFVLNKHQTQTWSVYEMRIPESQILMNYLSIILTVRVELQLIIYIMIETQFIRNEFGVTNVFKFKFVVYHVWLVPVNQKTELWDSKQVLGNPVECFAINFWPRSCFQLRKHSFFGFVPPCCLFLTNFIHLQCSHSLKLLL